jgi:hypothetical protein
VENNEIIKKIETIERRKILNELQYWAEKNRKIPVFNKTLLNKISKILQCFGSVILGIIIGISIIILNFFVFVSLLHISF